MVKLSYDSLASNTLSVTTDQTQKSTVHPMMSIFLQFTELKKIINKTSGREKYHNLLYDPSGLHQPHLNGNQESYRAKLHRKPYSLSKRNTYLKKNHTPSPHYHLLNRLMFKLQRGIYRHSHHLCRSKKYQRSYTATYIKKQKDTLSFEQKNMIQLVTTLSNRSRVFQKIISGNSYLTKPFYLINYLINRINQKSFLNNNQSWLKNIIDNPHSTVIVGLHTFPNMLQSFYFIIRKFQQHQRRFVIITDNAANQTIINSIFKRFKLNAACYNLTEIKNFRQLYQEIKNKSCIFFLPDRFEAITKIKTSLSFDTPSIGHQPTTTPLTQQQAIGFYSKMLDHLLKQPVTIMALKTQWDKSAVPHIQTLTTHDHNTSSQDIATFLFHNFSATMQQWMFFYYLKQKLIDAIIDECG